MENLEHLRSEVEKTLESLDGIQRAETSPYFYTRLMARMEGSEKTVWNQWMSFLARPAISLGILFLFLLMNGYLIFNKLTENDNQLPQDSEYVAQQVTYFENNTP